MYFHRRTSPLKLQQLLLLFFDKLDWNWGKCKELFEHRDVFKLEYNYIFRRSILTRTGVQSICRPRITRNVSHFDPKRTLTNEMASGLVERRINSPPPMHYYHLRMIIIHYELQWKKWLFSMSKCERISFRKKNEPVSSIDSFEACLFFSVSRFILNSAREFVFKSRSFFFYQ